MDDSALKSYHKRHLEEMAGMEYRTQILLELIEDEEREAAKRGIDLNAV